MGTCNQRKQDGFLTEAAFVTSDSLEARNAADTITLTPPNSFNLFMFGNPSSLYMTGTKQTIYT